MQGQVIETPEPYESPAQKKVVDLLLTGISNAEIGRALGISDKTVKYHLTTVIRSYGVKSRLALVVLLKDHPEKRLPVHVFERTALRQALKNSWIDEILDENRRMKEELNALAGRDVYRLPGGS